MLFRFPDHEVVVLVRESWLEHTPEPRNEAVRQSRSFASFEPLRVRFKEDGAARSEGPPRRLPGQRPFV